MTVLTSQTCPQVKARVNHTDLPTYPWLLAKIKHIYSKTYAWVQSDIKCIHSSTYPWVRAEIACSVAWLLSGTVHIPGFLLLNWWSVSRLSY